MDDIIREIRMSRAFSVAFYEALKEGKVTAPDEVIKLFMDLKNLYDEQMNRELS